MSALAVLADPGHGPDPRGGSTARLVVSDADDVVVGWVELASGRRHVTDPGRSAAFHEAVDLWLEMVEYAPGRSDDPCATQPPGRPRAAGGSRGPLRLTETRFPDPPVRRTLVVPLRRR